MKKRMTGMMLAAAVTVLGASAVFADGVDVKGVRFEIPDEISELVTVRTDGLEEGELVSVYETASLEAAQALGEDNDGAGWIFTISTIPEDKLKELRCGGMEGMDVFAEDDDIYYIYNHPTDVRMVRQSNEEMKESMDSWDLIHQWAGQEVCQEILANNPKFELRCLDYGPDALDPAAVDEDDFIEDLAEDFTYEYLPDAKAPAGEYYVLAFGEGDDEVRFDFFKDPEGNNMIREVVLVEGEEYETIYQANPKDIDEDDTTTGIMEKWCAAIADGKELDD